MTNRSYHFTLCRPEACALAPLRIVIGASALPVTAGSEWRVAAPLRRVGAELEERHPSLESIEALCRFSGDADEALTPGLILFDRRFLLWIALFDETAFVSLDTELLADDPRKRFHAARQYLAFLQQAGYRVVFDHDGNRLDDDLTTFSEIIGRLAAAGQTGWFHRLRRNVMFSAVFSAVGFGLVTAIMDASARGAWPALWEVGIRGVAFGLFMSLFQYWWERRRLRLRLQQIRRDLVSETGPAEHLVFRKSRLATAVEVAVLVFFVGLALVGFVSGSAIVGFFFGTWSLAAVVWLVMGSRGVMLDRRSIEGPSRHGRTRIPYSEVLQIRHWPAVDITIVRSESRWLVIPGDCDEGGRFVRVLWDRVHEALAETSPQAAAAETELLPHLRTLLAGARRAGFKSGDIPWPPLWMILRHWNHPLHPQFRAQRRLLRDGQLVMARVLEANSVLFKASGGDAVFDAPAIVLFAVDSAGRPANDEVVGEIAARLIDPSPSESRDWFEQTKAGYGGLPLMVPFPPSLSQGYTLYCTSLMIVRRHIPLEYLRANWLPLLVNPAKLHFSMVLPMRLWPSGARLAWRRGDSEPNAAGLDEPPRAGLEKPPRVRSAWRRAAIIAAIIVVIPVIALPAMIYVGPLISGALFLTRAASPAPASHAIPLAYPPKHVGHVDVSTGLYIREDEDVILDGTPPFRLTRTYLSQDRISRPMGVGTTSNAEWWLIGDPVRFQWAELILADGSRARFERTSWGTSYTNAMFVHRGTPMQFDGARLGWMGLDWAVRFIDGRVARFYGCSPGGHNNCALKALSDEDGHTLRFRRDSAGRLTAIEGADQRIAFAYDADNRVTTAQTDRGTRVDYSYDEKGRLIRVRSSEGVAREYTYGSRDEMLTIREPGWFLENTYDDELRMIRQVRRLEAGPDRRLGEAETIDLSYVVSNGAVAETRITEFDGTHTVYRFNDHHRSEVEIHDAAGPNPAVLSIDRDPIGQFATGLTVRCSAGGRRVTRSVAVDEGDDELRAKQRLVAESCSTQR